MVRRFIAVGFIMILLMSSAASAVDRSSVSIRRLNDTTPLQLNPTSRLTAADTCTAIAIDSLVWLVDSWLFGDELYKVLLDPAETCANPYPFAVQEVHIVIYFDGVTPFTYSGDVETVNYDNPACPMPGEVLGVSPTYTDEVPAADLYDIWVEFDPPVVVNEPFFAGFYVGPGLDQSALPSLVTDDSPEVCNSFNIWDETEGWVDVCDNEWFSFPGKLAIFAVGTIGGAGGETVAAFAASPTTTCPYNSVSFSNQSTGDISSYLWDFGDDQTSTLTNPSHSYSQPGQYTVSLTANGPSGSDTELKTNYITVSNLPTAQFTASPTSGSAPLNVSFTNQSSDATSWLWNFGDGGTSTQQNPSHIYEDPGAYTVVLTAYNDCGNDLETKTAYVSVGGASESSVVEWLHPVPGQVLRGSADLWTADTSIPGAIDYVTYEYSGGGAWQMIGSDFDGATPLRNGASTATAGTGFSYVWDFSGLAEGTYQLRVTAHDTSGSISGDTISVYLEPTPPVAAVVAPDDGSTFCSELELLMVSSDENLSYVEIHRHAARVDYSAGLSTTSTAGVNCGPAVAAVVAKLWSDRGYSTMQAGATTLSVGQLTDSLAARAETAVDGGSYDELLYRAMKYYFAEHGNLLDFAYMRYPDYYDLRRLVEEEQAGVMVALSGSCGLWLAVDGFTGWPGSGDLWALRVSDPTTGTFRELPMRQSSQWQVQYSGQWLTVDIAVAMTARAHAVSRQLMGADFDGSDGWTFTWAPTGAVSEDSLYYFRTTGRDAGGLTGSDCVLLQYNCGASYESGDYNGDRIANIMDLSYLVEFITSDGPEPVGGPERADANGDGYVNIADVVYYMNFLFGSSSPPSY